MTTTTKPPARSAAPTRRGRILRLTVDPADAAPLHRQVYRAIRGDIRDGLLPPGTALPSTRTLARDVGVSRSTIVLAYEQLRADGLVETAIGAGTRVATHAREPRREPAEREMPAPLTPPRLSDAARRVAAVARRPLLPASRGPRAFRVGVPAVDAFPVELWGRLLARRWGRAPASALSYADPFGLPALREAVAEYLRAARGVRCAAEQVMITAGSQQALDLCARLLLDHGDEVWVEDPGYHGARGAFVGAGATLVPVPVDDEGLVVATAIARAPRARMACVTPTRQLPLGVPMSGARRRQLLDWAEAADAWIVEDDYDSEFHYAERPLPALRSLDAGRVLYVGTFSKVMFPALRLGYVVLPERLVDAACAVRQYLDYHAAYLEQAVMADFIADGHFERHIRRMRRMYAARRAVLVEAAARELAGALALDARESGMHVVGWLGAGTDDVAVARAAERAGVEVMPLSAFALRESAAPGLLLGFAGVDEVELREGVTRLARVLGELRAAR